MHSPCRASKFIQIRSQLRFNSRARDLRRATDICRPFIAKEDRKAPAWSLSSDRG